MSFQFTVNGEPVAVEATGTRRLLDVIRDDLGLTGTKEGCGEGECGACSVLIDGAVVDACLVPVSQAQEMYQALIEAGCETELVLYPREGHGYLEREHQLDLWERMRDWFARHLG